MPTPITPDRYDPATAAAMAGLGNGTDGLPAYLGIRTTHVGPATMTAELDVRADLLNPFGTLHGGVLAALVDHVLGAVLYPVIEQGRWAATTEFKVNLLAAVRDDGYDGPVVVEAAVLIEAGWRPLVDELWVVSIDREKAIDRVVASRGVSRAEVERRMDAQLPDAARRREADLVIDNSGGLDALRTQVEAAWRAVAG